MMRALLLPEDHLLSDTDASTTLLAIRFVIAGSESGIGNELYPRATFPMHCVKAESSDHAFECTSLKDPVLDCFSRHSVLAEV